MTVHTIEIFTTIIVLLFAAVVVATLFHRMRMPVILGYLVVGTLLGPHLLGFISSNQDVLNLAEFGVVFLLFTVGLEFSWPKLLAMRSTVLGYGILQVFFSIVVTTMIGYWLGMSLPAAVVVGGVVAMSSTAIVVKQLSEEMNLNTLPGQNAVGILLLQDIAVIPLLIFIPALGLASTQLIVAAGFLALVNGALAIFIIYVTGRWLLRPIFRRIAALQSVEIFTLTTLLIALSAAWLTHFMGLSLALGAFLAGVMLGETEYRHQINVEIRPFRDVLLGLFFITIGMQLDLTVLVTAWIWVLYLLVALILFKTVLVMLLGMLFGHDPTVSLRTGLVLAQGGEFGFAILVAALNNQLLPEEYSQVILSALVLSMALSPILINYNQQITAFILPKAMQKRFESIKRSIRLHTEQLQNHAIICGFGRVGQHVSKLLAQQSIPYVALDLDVQLVQEAKLSGINVNYGDASRPFILQAAGIDKAKALVICINSRGGTSRIVKEARQLRKDIPILIRVYNEEEYDELKQLGNIDAIPEVLELSLILGSRLLLLMGVSAVKVFQMEEHIRRGSYQMLRKIFPGSGSLSAEEEPVQTMSQLTAIVIPQNAYAINKSLAELELIQLNVEVIGVRRDNLSLAEVNEQLRIQANDVVVLFGKPEDLARAEEVLLKGSR